MPTLRVAPDLETDYERDDFTDRWTKAGTNVLLHGNAKGSTAWTDHIEKHGVESRARRTMPERLAR